MDRDEQQRSILETVSTRARHRNCDCFSEQAARRRRAKCDHSAGLHDLQFTVEPRLALRNFESVRAFVKASFTAHLKLEMLDGIRNKKIIARNLRLCQRPLENPTRRTHKGLTSFILAVPRLLANEHEARAQRSFAGHDLSCESV